MKNAILISLIVLAASAAGAQSIGDVSLTNASNGKAVSLSDYRGASAVVVIFTGIACPYDQYYASRIGALIADLGGKVPVLLVNAHTEPAEGGDQMKAYAASKGLNAPYLADKEQVLMTALRAQKSPEAFVLKPAGDKFNVVYRGAIDDNPQVASDVKRVYLREAITALLEGNAPASAEVRPVGCNIKKK